MIDKKKLRELVQNQRNSLPARARQKKSRAIAERLFMNHYYKDSKTLLAYYPFRSEIDTTIIVKKALAEEKKVILPRVEQKILKLYYVRDLESQLEIGTYGIMEPDIRKCKPAKLKEIELALVPGLAFDRNLNRLGYGGGFYDRLLGNLNPDVKKIALCFNLQLVPAIPVLEHDIKVDVIITESEEIIGQQEK